MEKLFTRLQSVLKEITFSRKKTITTAHRTGNKHIVNVILAHLYLCSALWRL